MQADWYRNCLAGQEEQMVLLMQVRQELEHGWQLRVVLLK